MTASTRVERGLNRVEIVVVLVVLVLLAGVLGPAVGSARHDASAAKILLLAEALRKGCARHVEDTGTFALEYSGAGYSSPVYHQLSLVQSYPGWKGPYVERPLSTGDNPFGGFVYLYNNLIGGSASPAGFDPSGSGTPTASGKGQFVGFSGVPEAVAVIVDHALDAEVPGEWRATGRVEYSTANAGTLMILLMSAP